MEVPNGSANQNRTPRGRITSQSTPRRPNSQVSSCSTRMNQKTFSNYWSIENFSVQMELHSPGEYMLAPKFGDTDYEFVMKLFPNGKDEETSHYLSLFLLINKCPNPRLRFRVSFTVETADGPRSCHLNKNLVTINRSGIVTASKFFSLEVLRTGPTIYTPKDVLTIGCELTIFGESLAWTTNHFHPYSTRSLAYSSSSSAASPSYRLKATNEDGGDEFMQTLANKEENSFIELLSTGDFSDFTVVSSCGREFHTHMCVLSARSEYFRGLLRNKSTKEFSEKRVVFEDISANALEIILRHIYNIGGTHQEEPLLMTAEQVTPELATAVDRLMVTSMRTEISMILSVNVTTENVVPRMGMAAELRLDDTYQRLLEYFAAHKKECLQLPIWDEMRAEKPSLTIKILEDAILAYEDSMASENRNRIIDRITIT